MKRRAFVVTAALGTLGYLGYRASNRVRMAANRSKDL